MRTLIAIALFTSILLLANFSLSAQSPTPTPVSAGFSGTWRAVQTVSEIGEGFYDRSGRPLPQRSFSEHTLTVVQKDNEFRVTTTFTNGETYDRKYRTDGSGEVNIPSKSPKIELASKSRLKNRDFDVDVVVRDAKSKREESYYRVSWRLSRDGNELTLESVPFELTVPGDHPRSPYKQHYKRVS